MSGAVSECKTPNFSGKGEWWLASAVFLPARSLSHLPHSLCCPTPPGLQWGSGGRKAWGAPAAIASSGHGRRFQLTLSLVGTFMGLSEPSLGISHHPFPWHRQVRFLPLTSCLRFCPSPPPPQGPSAWRPTSGCVLLDFPSSLLGRIKVKPTLSHSLGLVFRGSKLLPHPPSYPVFRPLLPTLAL